MGAWGYKPFENDSALDARCEVKNYIEAKLRSALRSRRGEEEALAYVKMLTLLGEKPSTEEFGAFVSKKMVDNFNAPELMHRRIARRTDGRISRLVEGRRGDVWNDPKKRLAVIRSTIRKWINLANM